MKSKGSLTRYSMMTLTLNCLMLIMAKAEETFFNTQCTAPYSEGSVTKPCTVCAVCVKKWDKVKNTTIDGCTLHSFFYTYLTAVQRITPFVRATVGDGEKSICSSKEFCHPQKTDFTCNFSRPSDDWQKERVSLLSDCKCRCDAAHYGQTCNLTIPSGLTIDSIADIQNIVYAPIVYATDYASVYVYVYNKGINLNMELQTETQNLRYDAASCRTDVPRLEDLCSALFQDGGVRDYLEFCMGGPTYEEHEENAVCAVVVNIAFPKDKLRDHKKDVFFFDDADGSKSISDAKIVAKVEKVSVTISNEIPNLDKRSTILSTVFGITVVYRGKSPFEDCPVFVSIPQYSEKSETAPSFPRSQDISLTNLVVLEEVPECENLGEPVTNWLVWDFIVNHDEKNDQPVYELFETPTLTFEPFSLAFGKYKVKSLTRFIDRNFDTAFAYCYFEIIPIPLQPLIFGGSLRYIYYKSNFDLISDILVDPNYPISAQPKLKRIWHCDDVDDKLCDEISGNEISVTKYGPFQQGKSYYFTMSVQSPLLPEEFCHQTIIISKDPIPSLLIECLRNCGGAGFRSDTREIFYFKVNSKQHSSYVTVNNVYNWSYSMDNGSFIDVHAIRQEEETPSWILIVNDNSLKDNHKYTFKVTGGGEKSGEAQIQVHMFKYTDKFHCTIHPTSGIAGQTKFTIECNKAEFEQNHRLALNIYFYDKFDESDELGRLLGSNYMESIEDVVLTRGTVMVSATNMFGQFQKTHVKVSLTSPKLTAEFLNESIHTLYRLSENEGYDQKLSYISSLCDVLNKEPSIKEKYLETFLEVIDEEDSIDLVHLELLLSVTQSVLCNGNNCTNTKMSDKAYKFLSKILMDVSQKLVEELKMSAKGYSDLTSAKVTLLYTSLLKCSGILLSVKNKDLADSDSMTVDYNVYNLYKVGNLQVLDSLDKVNEALSIKNIPFIKHSAVRTDLLETWMKEDTPIYFTGGTKGNHSGSYLVMTPALAKSLKKVSYHIVIFVMAFKNDPYWWSQTEDVSTQVVHLSIGYTRDLRTFTPITSFSHPIDIFLKKNDNLNATVSGSVTQPDSGLNVYIKDVAVNVHKVYALKGEKINFKFVDLDVGDVFRVFLIKNRRPDYDMVRGGFEVSQSSPWYHSPTNIKVNEDTDIVFIGILPGESVPVNETRSYKFELQSARCQVWYDFLWDASGCSLGGNSSKTYLHCQCTHLSSVAGFIGVPINTINPLTDYTLFLTIPENPLVFALVLTILLIYILLLIWSCIANKRDLIRTSLIILEDNISSDTCGYLVIVFTGSRLYAGTTSHIGIILHGSQTSSRSHILKSSQRSTLQRGNDDWFLLYTPESLGEITSVQLWSDHTGTSPNWFCDRIHVHDFSSDKDYSFLIGKWFGVTQLKACVEFFARPIKLEKEYHGVDFFLTNIVFGFRESHIWFSILTKHPRSLKTRAQRLSIAVVALVTTLLGCILFYDATLPEDEDLPGYSVSTREALISTYTMCISIVVTGVVFFAFSKSYTYEDTQLISTKMAARRVLVDSAESLRLRKEATRGFKYYIKKVIISLRQNHFYPIQARTGRPQEQQIIIVHKVKLILSWIFCTSVILIFCFLTVWLGLKIGKNKSLLWLTSIVMSLVEDTLIVDPVKIVTIALLFGMMQTQLCDLFAYDPKIYEIRSNIMNPLERDQHIHKLRFQPLYKPASRRRLRAIQDRQWAVIKWWDLIDILDIVFSMVVIFFIIETSIHKDYFYTNSIFTNIVFTQINPNMNLVPSPVINNYSRYSRYLQDSVFPGIYCTQWYNKLQLTEPDESFVETGWAKTNAHRMIGVPRLRQSRVVKENCELPPVLKNLSVYCNVRYSGSTEDTEYYSAKWKSYTSQYVDVVFEKSPWIYTSPEEVSTFGIASKYSETGELFHGAGYIAELTRTRKRSDGTLLNLEDLDWLDIRTRIVFFELSAYNINNKVFTAMMFIAEHLDSSLFLASKTVRSIVVDRENALLEVMYCLYSVLVLIKLLMILNTVGPRVFFASFWTLYDLCFALVGLAYCLGYRIIIEMFSDYIREFQRSEKEDFFPYSGLFFTKTLDRYIIAILFIVATTRCLRLLKYESSIMYVKHRYTLYYAWPQILCVTSVLLFFMFSYQRLLEYLLNCLYPLGTSHWLQHKMNFRDIQRATVTPNTMFFVYIPCCLSCLGLVFYMVVLIESYSCANAIYMDILHKKILSS